MLSTAMECIREALRMWQQGRTATSFLVFSLLIERAEWARELIASSAIEKLVGDRAAISTRQEREDCFNVLFVDSHTGNGYKSTSKSMPGF